MTATKREERIAELNELMQEWEMTQRETLFAILFDFYEAAAVCAAAFAPSAPRDAR